MFSKVRPLHIHFLWCPVSFMVAQDIKKITGMAYDFWLWQNNFLLHETDHLMKKPKHILGVFECQYFSKGKQCVPTPCINATKYSECKQVFYPRFFPQLFHHLDRNTSSVQYIMLFGGYEAYRYIG